ncbi:elongation factor Ts, partial [Candidatus Microgenomates bacterium]
DEEKAYEAIKQKGLEIAEEKKERETKAGIIEVYSHAGGKVVGVVELLSETDFVARNDEFKSLAHELAMQVAAMSPKDKEELLEQDYIRDPSKKVKDLVNEAIGKIRENIQIGKIARFEVGA